ncbi:MAG: ABC transporter permease [Candidatus Acidiferrales bacterium]
MWQDVKYGLRMLAKAPGFTAVAVLTLALGIGANTAIFSAVNGILLKPLPYADASQLVSIEAFKQFPSGVRGVLYFSSDVWQKMRVQTPAIAQMALWNRDEYTITGDAAPELVSAARVSSEFFPLLGVRPLAGRPILPGDTQPGAKPVAVISYALWRSRWGDDNGALNRTITLDDKTYTIVGVMPPGFTFPITSVLNGGEGIWLPLVLSPGQKGGEDSATFPIARLKQGVSLAAANAQLKTISTPILSGLSGNFTGMWSGTYFLASALKAHFSDLDNPLLILLGAVGFVLLIACVNVSGLLLARGWARHREVAIREALGASRVRIVRQFLTESILLALAGGALGLLFAVWGVHVLRVITPNGLPEHGHFVLNANILWFTLSVSLLTGILFGLAPALQASTRRVGAAIRDGFGSLAGTSSRRPRRLRSALVVIEIALAVILVIGATLVARSFEKLTSVKLGFRADHIVTMDANFSKSVCDRGNPKDLAGCQAAVFDVLDRMRRISGVRRAAVASAVPLAALSMVLDLKIEGQEQVFSMFNGGLTIATRSVSPDYFRAFGIPLLSGRSFTDADTAGSQRVVIVNEAFAKKYLGDHALGRRISTSTNKEKQPEWMQVVGVVASTQDMNLQEAPAGEIYLPFAQADYFQRADFIARTSGDPAVMIPALRQAIWSEDKNAPITTVETMDQIVSSSVAEPRFQALLLGSFGALGLLLAMVGIYGVISYSVTQRTREIGVRMALGAQPGNVLRMVIREGMLLAGVGIAAGVGGALALTRFLQSLLFEIKPTDLATFVGVAVVLALVALVACYVPARRAMRVEPIEALRYE